jgi:glutamate formiminotransferase/formiminotetrahydrofolate cyclodeaminase
MSRFRQRAEMLRRDLLALVDRDAAAYESVVTARRLPKGTGAEVQAREAALARANLFATETPLATAEGCATLMEIAVELARKGNINAASDAGSGALLAYAGLRAGVMNIRTNLPGIADPGRRAVILDRLSRLEVEGEKHREEALVAVYSRIGHS